MKNSDFYFYPSLNMLGQSDKTIIFSALKQPLKQNSNDGKTNTQWWRQPLLSYNKYKSITFDCIFLKHEIDSLSLGHGFW